MAEGESPGLWDRFVDWFTSPGGWKGVLGRALLVLIVISILTSPFNPEDTSDSQAPSGDDQASETEDTYQKGTSATDDGDSSGDSTADDSSTEKTKPPNEPPEAAFSVQCDGLNCTFDGRNSTDNDGHIVDYAWELSSVDFPYGSVVNHSYDQGGTYQIRLTVTDNRSDTDSAIREITVTAPEPDPITFSGSGDTVTDFFTTEFQLLRVHLSHDGDSNFIVWLVDEEGNKEESLANKIGRYDASRYFNPLPNQKYLLDIQADGAWEIRIEQPRPKEGSPMPANLSGAGDTASEFLSYEEGLAVYDMSFSGDGNFIVWLYSKDGTRVANLANEIGDYEGSTTERIPRDGIYALDIVAGGSDTEGDWTIQTQQ